MCRVYDHLGTIFVAILMLKSSLGAQQAQPFVRDLKIPIDDEYTKKIKLPIHAPAREGESARERSTQSTGRRKAGS
jgi:hypothetical protein